MLVINKCVSTTIVCYPIFAIAKQMCDCLELNDLHKSVMHRARAEINARCGEQTAMNHVHWEDWLKAHDVIYLNITPTKEQEKSSPGMGEVTDADVLHVFPPSLPTAQACVHHLCPHHSSVQCMMEALNVKDWADDITAVGLQNHLVDVPDSLLSKSTKGLKSVIRCWMEVGRQQGEKWTESLEGLSEAQLFSKVVNKMGKLESLYVQHSTSF